MVKDSLTIVVTGAKVYDKTVKANKDGSITVHTFKKGTPVTPEKLKDIMDHTQLSIKLKYNVTVCE